MAGKSNVQLSSPLEMNGQLGPFDEKLATADRYGHEGVAAGARAAVVAAVASAVPTLASVRMIPWARRNLNPTAQALIVSLVAGSAFFIVADKTVLTTARKNSFGHSHP
ncbi:early nodulin-93-like [Nymphaea colorata]|nr:early nodulin-93-like [Nymphaea colorata]